MATGDSALFRRPIPPLGWPLLGLALIVLAEISRYFTVNDLQISAIWPVAGIFVGATAALGYRALLVLAPSLVFWLIVSQSIPWTNAVVAVAGQAIGATTAVWLMRRFWRRQTEHRPLSNQIALYTRCALIGGALVSAIGTVSLTASANGFERAQIYDVWLVYWAFEALGIILFAPLSFMLLWAPRRFLTQLQRDWRSGSLLAWLALTIAATGLALVLVDLDLSAYSTAVGFAFFPLLCWFVLQARQANVALVIPASAALFTALALNGMAGLPPVRELDGLIRTLLLVGGLAVMAQVIAAISAERRRLIDRFQHQARSDYLTGLNNDREFARQLESAFAEMLGAEQKPLWLCYLHVLEADRFEDLLGFEDSQKLEILISESLLEVVDSRGLPARIGDGSYAMLLRAGDGDALLTQLERLYQRFDGQLLEPGEHQTRIRVALGAVPLNGSLVNSNHCLSAATQAARQASQQLHRVMIIEDVGGLVAERRQSIEQLEQIKAALAEDRFELFAQRIHPLTMQGAGLHFEILLRLRTHDGNLLGPGNFLPVAEAFGFMVEIDQWVIRRTLQTLARHPEWLDRTAQCAINLAGSSFANPELVPFIRAELAHSGVPARKMCFEITETERIEDRAMAVRIVRDIRDIGCCVSLDDFGTGLASFDYLRSFELDYLKIDGLFVRDMISDNNDGNMVQAMCNVAQSMSLHTIAEFVENDAVIERLRLMGVDYAQGFGIARPQPLHELLRAPEA